MSNSFVPDSPYQALLQTPGGVANARITLVSGQPVMSSTVLAATQVIITPYMGSRIPIFNPVDSVWRYELFSETAFQLTLGTGAQQVTTASNYDVYCYLSSTNSGARPLFALSPAWASDTSIGTNPGSAERIATGGILLNRWNIPGGPPPMRGTYLGTIRTGSSAAVDWQMGSTQAGWGTANLCVYNYFNRKLVAGLMGEAPTTSWTWTSTAYRPAAGATSNSRVSALLGVSEDPVSVTYVTRGGCAVAVLALAGIGVDNFTSNAGVQGTGPALVNNFTTILSDFKNLVGPGYHFFQATEAVGQVGTTATFLGGAANPSINCGMTYQFWM